MLQAPARPVWLLIGPALAAMESASLLTATLAAGSALQRALGLSASTIGAVVGAFLLAAAVTVPAGVLVGRRWPTAVAVPAIVLIVVGPILTALAPSTGQLLVGQVVTGLGAGAACGVAAALATQVGRSRTPAVVGLGVAVLLSLVLGPLVGTLLASALSWRWIFLLAVPVGLLALLATAVTGIVQLYVARSMASSSA